MSAQKNNIMNAEKFRDLYLPAYKVRNRKKQSAIPYYEMAKDEVRRFCLQTGMHGFQYIAKPDNTPNERFAWTFISFAALLTAVILSCLSWLYSAESPTLIVTDSMQDPISNFLYPAVSICSLNKISKKKVINFLNNTLQVENITYWTNRITLLSQMYFAYYDTVEAGAYNEMQRLLDKRNVTAEDALVAITPSCKEMMTNCMWKGRKRRCDRLFQTTRTPEGTCCSFFHYAFKNRSFDGYMAERYKPFPRKVVSCGQKSGLKVFMKHEPSDYMASEISAYGAKILIHDPYVYADWAAQRVLIPMERQVYADVNPVNIYATDEVRSISIDKRDCVFIDERKLQLFHNYSYMNCLTECRIQIIENTCGCMPFYYRNEWFAWTPPLRMCNLRDIGCLSANRQRFMSTVPGYDTYQTKRVNHVWGTEKSECNCRRDCERRNYDTESTLSKLSMRSISSNEQFFAGVTNVKHYSVVSVFFGDLTGTRNKRDISFTWTSIFGLFGGLLGLCLGFSFLAIVDILYTFTLRLGINIMRKKKELSKVKHEPYKPPGFDVLPLGKLSGKENKKYRNPISNVWYLN